MHGHAIYLIIFILILKCNWAPYTILRKSRYDNYTLQRANKMYAGRPTNHEQRLFIIYAANKGGNSSSSVLLGVME